eukprot:TRINITY_DN873_c0_g1_i2.p1 TRINITY_DN873_c0_g1~~TRINITY_DN873_c0_g1_i2.p1  ORF type:complete len:528 (+),score=85.25 TRINITY_DN873_c0_g1_i2:496-2079(+)
MLLFRTQLVWPCQTPQISSRYVSLPLSPFLFHVTRDIRTLSHLLTPLVSPSISHSHTLTPQYLNVQCDPGEVDADNSPLWNPEAEHTPSAIDSYARGLVQVRRKVVAPGPGLGLELDNVGSVHRAFSIASGTSRGTRRSKAPTSRTARSRLSRQASQVSMAESNTSISDAAARRREARKAPAPQPSTWRHPLSDARGEARSEEEAMMQAKFEAIKARELAEKQEQQALQKLQNEMRGKHYTFDSNGNVIVVKPVEPEKLPATRVSLKSSVKLTEEELAERERIKKYGKRALTMKKPEKEPDMAPPRKKENKPEVFKEFVPWQPPAVDTLPVNQGVTLREGSKVKAGPPPPEDPNRMTREKFNSMTGEATLTKTRTLNKTGGNTQASEGPESSINSNNDAAPAPAVIVTEPSKPADDKPAPVTLPTRSIDAQEKSPVRAKPTPRQKLSARGSARALRERPFVHSASPHVLQPTRDQQTGSFNASMQSTQGSTMGGGQGKPKYTFKAEQESSITATNKKLLNELLQEAR